jgi:hypothetical protein
MAPSQSPSFRAGLLDHLLKEHETSTTITVRCPVSEPARDVSGSLPRPIDEVQVSIKRLHATGRAGHTDGSYHLATYVKYRRSHTADLSFVFAPIKRIAQGSYFLQVLDQLVNTLNGRIGVAMEPGLLEVTSDKPRISVGQEDFAYAGAIGR